MISIQNVTKTFKESKKEARKKSQSSQAIDGKIVAVSGLSLEIPKGEIFCLLGPNGAGKTTTLRLIATLLKADQGTITLNGFDTVNDSRKVRDSIGFLTSDMKLAGNLSPREILQFFGALNHLPKERTLQQIEKLSKYLQMDSFLDKKIESCSTGMKQKTSIALTLIHDPDVIIFDEPTNGLDILAAKVVVDFIRDFKQQGKTILLSTHIMSEAEKLGDRIGIILKGHLRALGTKEALKQEYGQEYLEDVFFELVEREEAHVG
jgi:sodium transport system ATP-binding protein